MRTAPAIPSVKVGRSRTDEKGVPEQGHLSMAGEQTDTLWRNYMVVAGTIIVLITVARSRVPGNATVQAVCGLIEVALVIAHLVALHVGVRRHSPRHRWPWHLLSLTPALVMCAVVADTFNRELNGETTYPAIADVLFLLAVFPALTFIVLANHSRAARSDRAVILDASMVAIAAGLLAWAFLVAPHVGSSSFSTAAKVMLFSLPVIDVLAVGLVARMSLEPGERTVVFWSMLMANVALVIGDSAFTWFSLNNRVTDFTYGLSSSAWDVTYLLLFASALHPSMTKFINFSRPPRVRRTGRARLALVFIAAVIAPMVALFAGHDTVHVAVATSILLFGLVVARMEGMLREQESSRDVLAQTLEKLQAADVQLRQAQKLQAVGRLASGVAQEINMPVQRIRDNLKFLQEGTSVATENATSDHELLDEIRTTLVDSLGACDRVSEIVKAMNAVGNPANSTRQIMDLDKAIADILAITENETRDVAMVETNFGSVCHVEAYPADVNEVLLNLVTNAAHAVQDKYAGTEGFGHIVISTDRDGSDAIIRVTDDGIGIPDEIQARIFEPFFSTKDERRGSGQGLATVWSLVVDRHRGSIHVQSEWGVGTTVTVRLPDIGKTRFGAVSGVEHRPPVPAQSA
jgi:signal transduction histidine kinase